MATKNRAFGAKIYAGWVGPTQMVRAYTTVRREQRRGNIDRLIASTGTPRPSVVGYLRSDSGFVQIRDLQPDTEAAIVEKMFFMGHKDHIKDVRVIAQSRLFIHFDDEFKGTWSWNALDIDVSNLQLGTITVGAQGAGLEAKTKLGDEVVIDGASLRAAVDPDFASDLEKAFLEVRGPLANIQTNARSLGT